MIASLRNPRIAAARKLRRTRVRRETGRTLIEGPLVLEEALTSGVSVHEVFHLTEDSVGRELARGTDAEVLEVAEHVLDAMTDTVHPRGPVAVISRPGAAPLVAADSVVLWDIADPGNAGTIIRTAAALGFRVVATRGTVDLWSPKVLRAAVGGHFRTTICDGLESTTDRLIEAGMTPFVATVSGGEGTDALVAHRKPVALLIGNEAHGVPGSVRETPGVAAVTLTMPGGSESLNAAVAASILMYLRMGE